MSERVNSCQPTGLIVYYSPSSSGGTMTLAELLQREINDNGIVAVVNKTGVSHTSINNILDGTGGPPKLETFFKFSKAFHLPLWRVIEMAGFDLGLNTEDFQMQRLASILSSAPEYRALADELADMTADDLRATLGYLRSIVRERQDQRSGRG